MRECRERGFLFFLKFILFLLMNKSTYRANLNEKAIESLYAFFFWLQVQQCSGRISTTVVYLGHKGILLPSPLKSGHNNRLLLIGVTPWREVM